MRIVVAGGSGFLGHALSEHLTARGHSITVLTRDAGSSRASDTQGASGSVRFAPWMPDGSTGAWARALDGADAIINLAGAGIADKRWTAARKRVLHDSRILSTRSLVEAVRTLTKKPGVFIQGSAEGFYGSFDNGPDLDESSPAGSDFLARLCVDWEAEAQPVAGLGCRLAILRTGVVLSKHAGALKKMLPPFKAFVGGPLGTGRQSFAWVHLDDWVGLTAWAIANPAVSGVVNVTAPRPVTNAEFSRALGSALHRPALFTVPAFVLRAVLGEMATDALLRGQRVFPRRAQALGYQFRYNTIQEALAAEFPDGR